MEPKFRGTPLTYKCIDCTIGVGDGNGAVIVSQMEAHLETHPEHRLVVSSGQTTRDIATIASDIRRLLRNDVLPIPNDNAKGYGGEIIPHEDADPITEGGKIIEFPVGDPDEQP